MVARRGTGTFARDPARPCWRRVPASDPQALEDIGGRFPDSRGMRVKSPRRTASGWLLPVVSDGSDLTFAIDGKSSLISTLTVVEQGSRVVEQVRSLRKAPALATPQPRC